MGFFSGITELAFSPVKICTKTAHKVFDEEWEVKDALTCGLTKVLESAEEEVEDIKDAFDK
jgi:ferredoxin